MSILLVEDDAALADGISRLLHSHGMSVHTLSNGGEANFFLQNNEVSLIVLDIGLPVMDGLEVVRRLRKRGNQTPVLFLTARDALDERVHGLEVGADDYLVKPFASQELVARLKALLRRSSIPLVQFSMGNLVLDTYAKQARIKDEILELSVREWAVLEYLMAHRSRIVSKQQIIDAIIPWENNMTLNAVEVYISRLRSKILNAAVEIKTIRGFGYRLEEVK